MQAGNLRQRITIEKSTDAADGYGAMVPTWSEFAKRWASVEPLQGRELFAAQQVQPDVTHRVRLRYLAGVTSKMRLKLGTRVLEIEAVLNRDERNVELELLCREAA